MCPKPNVTIGHSSKTSHTEELAEPDTMLFDGILSTPNSQPRWDVITFPINVNLETLTPEFQKEIRFKKCKLNFISFILLKYLLI